MKSRSLMLVSILVFSIILSMSFSPNTPMTPASGADGTAAIVQMGFSEYMPGNSYIVILKGLSLSSDFILAFTAGCATNISFTTGANENEISKRVTLEVPTAGSECLIFITGQTDLVTVLDSVRLQSTALTDVINQDEIIDNLMIVLVIMVVVGLVLGIFRKMS